jgi:hypothetical protein
MGTESKRTEKPGKSSKPDSKDAALTDDQLKEVSGGGGVIEIATWQFGDGLGLPGGAGGASPGKAPSVSEINIKKP